MSFDLPRSTQCCKPVYLLGLEATAGGAWDLLQALCSGVTSGDGGSRDQAAQREGDRQDQPSPQKAPKVKLC